MIPAIFTWLLKIAFAVKSKKNGVDEKVAYGFDLGNWLEFFG